MIDNYTNDHSSVDGQTDKPTDTPAHKHMANHAITFLIVNWAT